MAIDSGTIARSGDGSTAPSGALDGGFRGSGWRAVLVRCQIRFLGFPTHPSSRLFLPSNTGNLSYLGESSPPFLRAFTDRFPLERLPKLTRGDGNRGKMPEKETIARARRDARQVKASTTQAGEFGREEIHHVEDGKHGVRNPKPAIAIGLAKARRARVQLAPPAKGRSRAARSGARSRPSHRAGR